MDANEHLVSPRRWWPDTELNQYLDDWVDDINYQFQLISTSTTLTIGSATSTITKPSTMLRIDKAYWNGVQLLPTTVLGMDSQHPGWEAETAQPGAKPWQLVNRSKTISTLYPIPGIAGTVVLTGPTDLSMISDSTVCPLPPWMYFSARQFCAYMCYMRAGPNQDVRKSSRYRAKYELTKKFYRKVLDARFASYGPRLKPAGTYEGAIITGSRR